jgi:hypothetical protein
MVDIVAGLRPGWPRVLIPVVESDFYVFFQNDQTCYGAHTTSHSAGTGVLPRRKCGRNVLATHLYLVPKLRMCGFTRLFHLYAFMS